MKVWNLSAEIKQKGDQVWELLKKGGFSGESLLEQISYLLLLRDLDQRYTREERKSLRIGEPVETTPFLAPFRDDPDLRWSRFKNMAPEEMLNVINARVFPFLRSIEPVQIFKEARFDIGDAALLIRVVDAISKVPSERPVLGEFYEYLVNKLPSPPKKLKYKLRTPRHIIELMVALVSPSASDLICDPCCGTGGFLVGVPDFFKRRQDRDFLERDKREHLLKHMLHGRESNRVSLLFTYLNLLFHGIESPRLELRDSLSDGHAAENRLYDLILANPPFKAPLDTDNRAHNLPATSKTELLFVALCLRLLKPGGRGALIVPDGVLFGNSKIHRELRRSLVEEQKLDAIISMPAEVFKPHSGVSAAIVVFTRTDSGGTEQVWFYDLQADGWSLDDKRSPLLSQGKLGCHAELSEEEHEKNNLPDILARWRHRADEELERRLTDQSFCVAKEKIAIEGYDLSINRYREIEHEELAHREPLEILENLDVLDGEIEEQKEALRNLLA